MSIAILGGTFNPIHLGHLYIADVVCEHFNCTQCLFIPNGQPPHSKQPIEAAHRIKMLELALEPFTNFKIDPRETLRKGPSYTFLTLKELREAHPKESLIFILGDDSFSTLESWFMWKSLLDYTHLVIMKRFNSKLSTTLQSYLQKHRSKDVELINNSASGLIYAMNQVKHPSKSSVIRQTLQNHPHRFAIDSQNLETHSLPQKVWQYLLSHQLYLT
jgi:nicotinate-nucleotide adenylyltransferase